MNVKYLFFANSSSEYYLFPVESLLGFEDYTSTALYVYFRTNDNPDSSATRITLNHTSGEGANVIKNIANTIATAKVPVLVIADDIVGSYIDPNITGIAIVSDVTQSSINASSISTTSLSVGGTASIVNLVTTGTYGANTVSASGSVTMFGKPVVATQPASADQAALTDSSGGIADGTIDAVTDTTATDQSATINNNFAELHTLLNEIRSALVLFGIIKGEA